MVLRVKSYKTQVLKRSRKAFAETAIALNQANQEVISQPQYWPGFENSVTYRQNGEVVRGAFRDIFDLGNIATSQTLNLDTGKASITWDGNSETPVLAVFYGFRTSETYVPGRNWIERALESVDLAQMFSDSFR